MAECGAKMVVSEAPKSCTTCRFNDLEPGAVGNPCWNCKEPDRAEWQPKGHPDAVQLYGINRETGYLK